MRSAAILVVGDEILSGEVADENGPYLIRLLAEAGVRVARLVAVPDREADVVRELDLLRGEADAVVVSGGLGPTHDDVTRPAVARALGVDLVPHPGALERVEALYGGRVTESERAQALLPEGSELLRGRQTATFGFRLDRVFVLPGVPFLFRDVAAALPSAFVARPVHRAVLETGRREGEIAPGLAALQSRLKDVAIGSYPVHEGGGWRVRVVVRAEDPGRMREALDALRALLA